MIRRVLFLFLITGFLACSPSKPAILQNFSQLNYTWDRSWDSAQETLTVFIHPENKDGLEQLDALYIVNDEAELYWTLGGETWTRIERPGETWLGANLLRLPGSKVLPRGNYRILLTTRSGEKERASFTIDSPSITTYPGTWPQVSVVAGEVFVSQAPANYVVWVYGTEGRLLTQIVMDQPRFPLEVIQANPAVSNAGISVWLYWLEEKLGVGVQTGPFTLNDLDS